MRQVTVSQFAAFLTVLTAAAAAQMKGRAGGDVIARVHGDVEGNVLAAGAGRGVLDFHAESRHRLADQDLPGHGRRA